MVVAMCGLKALYSCGAALRCASIAGKPEAFLTVFLLTHRP